MSVDPRLHHYAQNIVRGTLEDVLEMYQIFNCEVVYGPDSSQKWAMVGQSQLRFAIQVVEVDDQPITSIELKRKSHIAFLSENPKELINKVETWAKGKNIQFRQGGWSDRERYFDLPDIFVNFVIEVMHTSIEE